MQENENNIIEFPENAILIDEHNIQYKDYIWGKIFTSKNK